MYSVIEAHAFCVKKSLQELFYRQPSLRLSMSSISKSFSMLLILVLAVSSLIIVVATMPIGLGQSGTNTSTIISLDTTWTQANSPYNIEGNVLINNGTLTL